MLTIRTKKISAAASVGLFVASVGIILTFIQEVRLEQKNSYMAAQKALMATEILLDEARLAVTLAHPLLNKPCTADAKKELDRLAIGIEHIRVISLYYHGHKSCSSYESGRISEIEDYPAKETTKVTISSSNTISPGVPIMVLSMGFPEGTIKASFTTHWSAVTLQLLSSNHNLFLRVGNNLLSGDNKILTSKPQKKTFLRESQSTRYPVSVEYLDHAKYPLWHYIRSGWDSLFLSILLSLASAAGYWYFISRRQSLQTQLSLAIQRGEIVPWYQPIIDAKTSRIIGVEVLARWVKPSGEVVSPAYFIPLAESSNAIIPLTRQLMKQATVDLKELLADAALHWHIGFNFTQSHILNDEFIKECTKFTSSFLKGSVTLTVEITEREPIDDIDAMKQALVSLNRHGISIALDDFGTGYANWNHLSELNVNYIKIDGSFVSRIGHSQSSNQLLLSIFQIAEAIQLKVIAEGVETTEQATWLLDNGINRMQGFLFSAPVPIKKLEEIYNKNSFTIDSENKKSSLT